ncbi:MAG: alcohol dehydrogenase catalytic domain-containing protein [Actinobacteria bacterium]|nr:alcohol dehydrogenase catalytic domain-containing protein [Actinomycetota bacterium]
MEALRWHGRFDVRIDDVPTPTVDSPNDVVIAVEACGVCGSDVEEAKHGPLVIPTVRPHPLSGQIAPITLGHEIVGRVVEAGERAGVEVGTRVVPTPVVWCGECQACLTGATGRCEKVGVVGLTSDGGLAKFVRVNGEHCVPIHEAVPTAIAVLAEPYAVAIHALKGIDVADQTVAVVGFGSVGACVADVALAGGAGAVVAIDPDSRARNRALAGGVRAAVPPTGAIDLSAQLVFEASGARRGLATAVEAVAPGGTVVLLGIREGENPVMASKIVFGEVTVIGRVGHDLDAMRVSVDRLSGGSIGSRFREHDVVDLAFAKSYLTGNQESQRGRKVIVQP